MSGEFFFISYIYIYSFYSGNGIDLKMVGVHLEYYYELENFLIAKLLFYIEDS